jgi:arabinofuranosyltransferase
VTARGGDRAERSRRPAASDLLAGLAIVAVVVWGWNALWFLTDDAYIAFRYASNFVRGDGLVWNPAPFEPVEGYTSFLWVMTMALLWRATGLEPPVTANVVSLLAGLAALGLGVRWLSRLRCVSDAGARGRLLLGLAALGIATNRTFLTWLSSGLETALFNLLFLWWLYECFQLTGSGGHAPRLRLATAAALLALCRPDGVLAVAATPVVLLACRDQSRRGPTELLALAPLLAVAAHLLWRHASYGFWVPNTYYAKHLGAWPESGARYLGSFVLEYGWWLLALVAAAACWRRRRDLPTPPELLASLRRGAPRAIALGVLLAHAAYYTFVIGGDHFEFRVYSQLVIPSWIFAVALVCWSWPQHGTRAALLAALLAVSWPLPWAHFAATRNVEPSARERHGWLVRMAPRTPLPLRAPVALWDAWQEWLIGRFVCVRWHEHREFERQYRALLPRRLSRSELGPGPAPLLAIPSVGIAGWMLPDAYVRLVSCPSDRFTKSLQLFEDRVGGCGPGKGVAPPVVVLHEGLDLLDEISDAAKRPTANRSLGDQVEPDLDLIEPRRIGGRVVDVEAGARGEPTTDARVLVRRVVVDDEMDVELLRDRLFDVTQELKELLVAMPALALGEDATGSDIEGREEGGRPVADVVVGDAFDVAEADRQHGLGAVEGLDLALLVDTQDDRVVGRIQIEPDDVTHLLDEEGIRRDLEVLLAMGLKAERLPDALYGGLRDPRLRGDRAARPVRPVPGLRLQGLAKQRRDRFVADRTRPAGSRLIV